MKKIGTMIYVIAVVIAQYVSLKDFTNHLIFMLLYFKGFGAFFYPCCYLGCLAQDAGESCTAAWIGGAVPLRTKIRIERKIRVSFSSIIFKVF